jgi:protein-tyrosine phosphatase
VILFVCHGNICRSSYAAFSAERHLTATLCERIRILSAGYYGPDRPAPANAIDAAHGLGVDLRPHRSKLLTAELIASADLIIGMEQLHGDRLVEQFNTASAEFILLGTLDSSLFVPPYIDDPDGQSRTVFEQTYRRIDRCLATLVRALDDRAATV